MVRQMDAESQNLALVRKQCHGTVHIAFDTRRNPVVDHIQRRGRPCQEVQAETKRHEEHDDREACHDR